MKSESEKERRQARASEFGLDMIRSGLITRTEELGYPWEKRSEYIQNVVNAQFE